MSSRFLRLVKDKFTGLVKHRSLKFEVIKFYRIFDCGALLLIMAAFSPCPISLDNVQ